jgi:hypothetical protein
VSLGVGADIESLCGKCGDVWHVVVAKVGERIAKVQCKQCGREHRHRPPDKAVGKEPVSRPALLRGAAAAKKSPGAAKARATAVDDRRPLVVEDPSKPLRTYRAQEAYAVGDRLQHSQFGRGVVELIPGAGKIQVHFSSGRRVLAQARSAPQLEPPPIRRAEEGEDT